jgi:tetratricopeptide (TPR) repeat protein
MVKARRGVRARTAAPKPTGHTVAANGLAAYIGLIVVAGVLTYANGIAGPFIFDDLTAIRQNDTIRQIWPISRTLSPPRETPVAGRPVVNLSLAINYAIGGVDVTGYHVGNIALHVACALVLFGLVRRTLLGPRLRDRFESSANAVALVSALLWMVHPLQTEVVDYVTQRTESMMGLFWLLTLYSAIRASRSPNATLWSAASVLACALGMASKESMATVPVMVLLYDRVFEFDSLRQAIQTRWRLYAALAATWVELGAFMLGRPRSTVGASSGIDVWNYLLNQFVMVVQYLRLTLWPGALVLDYGLPRAVTVRDVVPHVAVVGSLLLATAVALVRWPRVGFLCAAFFLTLAPTTSIVPIASEVGAERRMYLPLAAFAVLVVLAGRCAWNRLAAPAGKPSRSVVLVGATVAAALLAALATRTVYRNAEYASPLALWRTAVERRPNGRARAQLASELIAADDHDEAMIQLREAVRDYPGARFALGTELYFEGKLDEALAQLQRLTAEPQYGNVIPAEELIGRILVSQQKLPEAAAQFQRVLDLNPSNAAMHGFLADVLFAQRRFEEAISHYQVLLASQPAITSALGNMGAALASVGRLDEAIAAFQRVAGLDPNSENAQRNLAQAYLQKGNAPQAELHAREAVRLVPRDPAAHSLLAVALASQQEFEGAIDQFRQTLELNPADAQARDGLALALRLKNSGGSAAQTVKPKGLKE